MRTPHIAVGPTTPFRLRPSFDRHPTGLSLNGSPGREVERKNYGGDFLMLPPGTAYGLPVAGFSGDARFLRLLRASPPCYTRSILANLNSARVRVE
jgi:hypothetical protein